MSSGNDDFMDLSAVPLVQNVLHSNLGYKVGTTGHRVMSAVMANSVDASAFAEAGIEIKAGVACGFKVFNRGNIFQIVNVVKGGPNGKHLSHVGWLKYNEAFDVPSPWFTKEYVDAISRINVLNEGFPTRGAFMYKMVMMSRNKEFRGIIESLVANKHLQIDVSMGKKKAYPVVVKPDVSKLEGWIKPEHVGRGFYTNVFKDSVFAFTKNGLVLSMEALNKTNERVTKIHQSRGISVGSFPVFVCNDVPDELKDAFVTGAVFVPNHIIERLGIFRMTSSTLGIKGVSQPMPASFGLDCLIISKSACKAAKNGVLAAMGLSPEMQIEYDIQEHLDDLDANMDTLEFMGHELRGWLVDEEIKLTNAYTLYGYVRPLEEDGDLDPEVSSYYVHALDSLKKDPGYDLVGDLISAINNMEVIPKRDRVAIKYQDLLNVYWSYGEDYHDAMAKRIAYMHRHFAPDWMKESQKVVLNGYGDAIRIDSQDMLKIINHIWSTQDGRNVEINIGKWDSVVVDNGGQRYKDLMEGYGDTWPGLMNNRGILVVHGEHEMYIPKWDVLEHYVHRQDDNLVFFSGPFSAFFKLLVSLRNENTEWHTKEIAHYMEIQKELLHNVVSRYIVKGRYYVALPKWWDNTVSSVIVHGHRYKEGRRVLYSKDPVLFDKAMCDVTIHRRIDKGVFGHIDRNTRMDFALGDVAFVSTKLLVDQQNDTDGDLICLRYGLGGICPLYTEQAGYTSNWVGAYRDGEYEMEMGYKSYQVSSIGDMSLAIQHAADAKGDIGIMSSNLFAVQHVLQILVRMGSLKWSDAQMIKETYAIMVQEEAVKQLKTNMSDGERFFDKASMYNEADSIVEAFVFAAGITGFTVDYRAVQIFAEGAETILGQSNFHAFRSPKVQSNLAFKYAKAKPSYMSHINLFMRAYYRNMDKHIPKYTDMNPIIYDGMDPELVKVLNNRKQWVHSYLNSQEVRNGFKTVHGWISHSGINFTKKPRGITSDSILYWLKTLMK